MFMVKPTYKQHILVLVCSEKMGGLEFDAGCFVGTAYHVVIFVGTVKAE